MCVYRYIISLPHPLHGFFHHANFEFHSNDILGEKITQYVYESCFYLLLFYPIIIVIVHCVTFKLHCC